MRIPNPNLNVMDPRLLSPMQSALSSMGQMNKNLLGVQQARQSGIETGFLPQQLQAALTQQQQKALQEKEITPYSGQKISADIQKTLAGAGLTQQEVKNLEEMKKLMPSKFGLALAQLVAQHPVKALFMGGVDPYKKLINNLVNIPGLNTQNAQGLVSDTYPYQTPTDKEIESWPTKTDSAGITYYYNPDNPKQTFRAA